jgi:MerR family redox-sensitive transcriptional activator SoxR
MTDKVWTVGKVAQRCGIAVSALHFYEGKGLIQSSRNAGNQRRYKADVVRRIAIIKTAQKMGVPLAEIKTAFEALPEKRTPTVKDWEKLSGRWQQSLSERIAYLEQLRDLMTGCIGCGCLSMKVCPLYNADDKMAAKGSGPVLLEKLAKESIS